MRITRNHATESMLSDELHNFDFQKNRKKTIDPAGHRVRVTRTGPLFKLWTTGYDADASVEIDLLVVGAFDVRVMRSTGGKSGFGFRPAERITVEALREAFKQHLERFEDDSNPDVCFFEGPYADLSSETFELKDPPAGAPKTFEFAAGGPAVEVTRKL